MKLVGVLLLVVVAHAAITITKQEFEEQRLRAGGASPFEPEAFDFFIANANFPAYGVPSGTFASYPERAVFTWYNYARLAPAYYRDTYLSLGMAAGDTSWQATLSNTYYPPMAPASWNFNLARMARAHSTDRAFTNPCANSNPHDDCNTTSTGAGLGTRLNKFYPYTNGGEIFWEYGYWYNYPSTQTYATWPYWAVAGWICDGPLFCSWSGSPTGCSANPGLFMKCCSRDNSGGYTGTCNCGGSTANYNCNTYGDGHRKGIMSNPEVGCGSVWDTANNNMVDTCNQGTPSGGAIQYPGLKVYSGAHILIPRNEANFKYMAQYYFPGGALTLAQVVVDGAAVALSLESGSAQAGNYVSGLYAATGACKSYHFEFTTAGVMERYPRSGEYRTYGVGSCAENFAAAAPQSCAALGAPTYGSGVCALTASGASCTQACTYGVASGALVRVCSDGTWGALTCTAPSNCNSLPAPTYGTGACGVTTHANTCSQSCTYGVASGTEVRTCTNGAWSGLACNPPPPCSAIAGASFPQYSTMTGCAQTASGSTCTVTCSYGVKSGNNVLLCSSGVWAAMPVCNAAPCAAIGTPPQFGSGTCPQTPDGNTCQLTCTNGVAAGSANPLLVCTNGVWSALPTCSANPVTPVDCVFVWSDWGTCSVPCGPSGTQSRSTTVTTPAQGTGVPCPSSPESRACNTDPCPVNGGWSDYGSPCPAPACNGARWLRACSNPVPANGGADCAGRDYQFCGTAACQTTAYVSALTLAADMEATRSAALAVWIANFVAELARLLAIDTTWVSVLNVTPAGSVTLISFAIDDGSGSAANNNQHGGNLINMQGNTSSPIHDPVTFPILSQTQPGAAGGDSGSSSVGVIVGAIVGVLLVIALVVGLVFWCKRRKAAQTTADMTLRSFEGQVEGQPGVQPAWGPGSNNVNARPPPTAPSAGYGGGGGGGGYGMSYGGGGGGASQNSRAPPPRPNAPPAAALKYNVGSGSGNGRPAPPPPVSAAGGGSGFRVSYDEGLEGAPAPAPAAANQGVRMLVPGSGRAPPPKPAGGASPPKPTGGASPPKPKPAGAAPPKPAGRAPPPRPGGGAPAPATNWVKKYDPSSRANYFYNSSTGVSQWTAPAGFTE